MLPSIAYLRNVLAQVIAQRYRQGADTAGLQTELKRLPDSYDALAAFAEKLERLPRRADYPYVEPETLEEIQKQCPADFTRRRIGRKLSEAEARERARCAFYGAVAGCVLGKPVEVDPTLAELRTAAEATGEWPLRDYLSTELVRKLGRQHPSAETCCRETIRFVTPDDDLNYLVVGLRMLEQYGLDFSRRQLADYWLTNLPVGWTWGPERKFLLDAGTRWQELDDAEIDRLRARWNASDEACGAAIRVDAYGYACPGLPALAAALGWRDASLTHRFTGVYASMYVAAAVAAAPVVSEPLEIYEYAIACVPAKSYFAEVMRNAMALVRSARDWLDGYEKIHAAYGEYGHCQLYQECAQLINTARFARSTEEAICMQVSQGCDTDCFGKIAGSVAGGFFGPDTPLPERWLRVFGDDFRVAVPEYAERSLLRTAERFARLPKWTLSLQEG